MRAPTDRRLLDDGEIHAAAHWRLAGWSAEEIAAGSARLARLLTRGIPLDSRRSEVAQVLAAIARRRARRESWSALMALAVLYADARGDQGLFLRAGFEVVTAWRNAKARARTGAAAHNALTALMREFQAMQPDATAADCFDRWSALAGCHPVFVDYDPERDVLTYDSHGRVRDVTRASFARQFRRVRATTENFFFRTRTQGVVVRAVA